MEEELLQQPPPDETPKPSTWDQVDALAPKRTGSVWDQVDSLGEQPVHPVNFAAEQGASRNPEKAARVIRLAGKFKFPESFVEQNLDTLEMRERQGDFDTDKLVNSNPKLADLIAKSGPNAASIARLDLPAWRKLDILYNRPQELWPISDEEIQRQSRAKAKVLATRDWAKRNETWGTDEWGNSIPLHFASQQQMEDQFYDSILEQRRAQEAYISGEGPVGFGEAWKVRAMENPAFLLPFGGDFFEAGKMLDLYTAAKAQQAGNATPEQQELVMEYARLERAAQYRGTSFAGKLAESIAGLPAFMGEFAMTGGIYSATEQAMFKGGKKAAELFLKGAFKTALEEGFAKSAAKKITAGAIASVPQSIVARGMAATAAELKSQLDSGEFKDLPELTKNILVRAYADVASAHSTKVLEPFSNAIFNKIVANNAGATLTTVQDQLRKAGLPGFVGMVGMGEMQKLINAAGGVAPYKAPTGEDIAIAAITGAVPHALAGGADILTGRTMSYKAQMFQEAAERRAELIKGMDALKKSPEQVSSFLGGIAEDSEIRYTHIPIEAWKEFYGDNATSEALKKLGNSKVYEVSRDTGIDLTIPTEIYDLTIGQDEAASKFFSKKIRSAPDAMNVEEGEQFQERVKQRMALPQDVKQNIIDQIVAQAREDNAKKATYRARIDQGGEPLLRDPAILGLSDQQIMEVSKLIAEGQAAAEDRLNKKEIDRRDRMKSDLYQAEYNRERQKVTAEVDARPEHMALSDLTNGTIKGQPWPSEQGSPPKISREAIKADFPALKLSDLPQGITNTEKSGGVGLHPDQLAELYGYKSGHDLLYALMGLNRDKTIEAETKQRMDAKYPNVFESSTLPDEAMRAIHNRYTAEVKRKTLEYIFENKLKAGLKLQEVASRKPPSMQSVREKAIRNIQELPEDRINPTGFLMAERRANMKALEEFSKGDFEKVFDAKLEELEAHEHYRASVELLEKIEKAKSDWRQVPDKAIFKKPETMQYGQQIKSLLRRIGFLAVDAEELKGKKPLGDWIKEMKESGDDRLSPIQVDPNFLDEAYITNLGDMKGREILDLKNTIAQITHLAREVNDVVVAGNKIRLEDWVSRVGAQFEANYDKRQLAGFTKSSETPLDKAARLWRTFDAANDRPEEFFTRLDGGKIDGAWTEGLFTRSSEAQTDAMDLRAKISKLIKAARKKLGKEEERRLYQRVNVPGLERPLTFRDIIGIALNGGNESNYSKTIMGEMKREGGLTEEQMQYAVSLLSEKMKDYVQDIHDAIAELADRSDELQRWATGVPLDRVESKQMFRAMGDRKGGYYPMMYDRIESKAGELQVSDTVGKLLEPSYQKSTTDSGYRKSRIEEYSAPVDFDIDRLGGKLNSQIQDLAYRKWVVDANKMVNHPEVRKMLKDYMGTEYMDVPRNWLRRVINDYNSPSDQSLSALRKVMGAARSNITIATLGIRASTFLHHALGIGNAIAEVGFTNFMKASAQFLAHPKAMLEMVRNVSGEMRHYLETQDTNIHQNLQELGSRTDFRATMQRSVLYAVSYGNLLRSIPTWLAAKERAVRELSAEGKTGEQLERLAVLSADRAVRITSGAGAAKDIPAIMSKNADFMRAFLMFHTPGSVLYSRLKSMGHDVVKTGDVSQFVIRGMWTWIAAASLHQLTSGRMPDESKDEGVGEWWLKEQIRYPFTALPLGGDIAGHLIDLASGEKPRDLQISPMEKIIAEPFEAISAGADWWNGDKELDEAVKKAFKASGYVVGMPTGQLSITGDYLYDVINGTADPNDLGEFVHDLLFSRPKERR